MEKGTYMLLRYFACINIESAHALTWSAGCIPKESQMIITQLPKGARTLYTLLSGWDFRKPMALASNTNGKCKDDLWCTPPLIYLFRLGLAEKYDYLLQFMSRIAGGEPIGFNNSVFLSERQTADRQPFAILNLINLKGLKWLEINNFLLRELN